MILSALLIIQGVIGIKWQIEFGPDGLSEDGGWLNGGSMEGVDMKQLKGEVQEFDGLNALCWDENKDKRSYIDFIKYNTNANVNPELTMIVWVRPQPNYPPRGNDWLLGHDNGGYDRSIIVFDGRYGGIAVGLGGTYRSTVQYPAPGEWTSVAATFSAANKEANIYKNGGDETQVQTIKSYSGSTETDIGLNGLRNYGNHNFVGCIGRVQIVNQVLTSKQIEKEFKKGRGGDPCRGMSCGPEEICDNGQCVRDCDVFAIDDYLGECSTEFAAHTGDINTINTRLAANDVDIAANSGEITANDVDIAQLQKDVTSNDDDIDKLRADVTSNDEDIAKMQTKIKDLKKEIKDHIEKVRVKKNQAAAAFGFDGEGMYGDKQPSPNSVKYVWDLSGSETVIGVLAVLLVANLIAMSCMCYYRNTDKKKYRRVRYMDSADEEANLK